MAAHEWSMRTSSPPSHLQLTCNGTYVALPLGRTSVGVWSLQSISSKPLELIGHGKPICCLCLGSQPRPPLLASSAQDYIIVWNIQKARDAYEEGNQIRGVVIYTRPGYVEHMDFSPDDLLLAVCIDKEVLILSSQSEHLHTTLEGHTARVTSAEFSPHHEALVVSISEDRTFKVWDISKNILVYQSTIISGSPFLCLALNHESEQVAIGSTDGQVRIYDMSEDSGFRTLHQLDVAKHLQKIHRSKFAKDQYNDEPSTISSKPSWKTPQAAVDSTYDVEEDDQSEAGSSIVGLFFRVRPSKSRPSSGVQLPSFLTQNSSVVQDLLEVPPLLVVGTTASILIVNAYSYDVIRVIDLQESLASKQSLDVPVKTISLVGSYSFSNASDEEQIWCLVGSIFQSEAHLLSLKNNSTSLDTPHHLAQAVTEGEELPDLQNLSITSDGDTAKLANITVLSSTPLLDNSPLKSELIPKIKTETKSKKAGTQKKSAIPDQQALTFHSKIKSSGYSQTTRQELFSPKTNKAKGKVTTKVGSGARALQKAYPVDADPPSKLKAKVDVAEHSTPIHQISFSGDGQHLACALARKCSVVFKMPLSSKGKSFIGHDSAVNCVSWSHSNQYLLTGSDDKTVKLWLKSLSEPILTFQNINEKQKQEKTSAVKKVKSMFNKEIRHAQFYYMDKFILIACDKAFYLYKYIIDTSVDDVKRYQSHSHYKLVNSYSLAQGQQLSALSAINSFYSYIILCAGSDKSLEVFDMNVGKSVRVTNNAHERTVHVVKQNQGSAYVTHPSSAYDLFATAAITDGIKIWDLRTNRCVKRFEGHQNRVHPCGLSFSPCGKYIATGSEDKSHIPGGTNVHVLGIKQVASMPVLSGVYFSSCSFPVVLTCA
ncbi:WD repeat-containing protein 27-like [Anneissia japonica]|uniref:WD repeat-containing protein 27-like n=1 Tax=Anneissia japonica TaxID=1529436 RepID=UPI0014258F6D|nr:WD repeat-containing protein 27-like [Anneissia japonica]